MPSQTFVCLECRAVVESPEGTRGFLRCPKGHRVQIVKSRSAWQIGLLSFLITLWLLSIVIHLFQTVWVSDLTRPIVWALLLATGASCVYLIVRGAQFSDNSAPIGTLGRQYILIGICRGLAVAALGALAAMRIDY